RSSLQEVRRRMADHPAAKQFAEWRALEVMIEGVFVANLHELLEPLEQAALDWQLATELVQNVHRSGVQERFSSEVARRLHNYVAAALSLVDHVRRIMKGSTDPLGAEFEQRKASVIGADEVVVIKDL